MGFNGDLAQQQFWEAHVRFGSKADVTLLILMSAVPPKADIRLGMSALGH
jgi:hypothetical protein